MKNWKTTLAGLLAVALSVAKIIQTGTVTADDLSAIGGGLIAGIGLFFARDAGGDPEPPTFR